MNILFVSKVGGAIVWLLKGRKTKLNDEIRADTCVSWIIGYLAIIIFIAIGIFTLGFFYE